jgi:dihydroorotase
LKKQVKKSVRSRPLPGQTLVIAGGKVIDPASGYEGAADIYIQSGRILKIETKKLLSGGKLKSRSDEVVDARGKLVVPGLIDMHVHLREPGREDEETILSGSEAAVHGGFTTICCMPNTNPPLDSQEQIRFVLERAARAFCHVYPIGAITKKQEGKELAEIADIAEAGAVAVSDDGLPVMNSEVMRRALEYSRMFDIAVIDHCEDLNLSGNGVMNESFVSTKLGLPGLPSVSEELMVYRDIELAEYTGARVHIAHVSTAGSVELIRQAKARNIKVTCEVTPHHFTLTDEWIKTFDSNYKMKPPLRSRSDVEALKVGLQDGTIDCIATDHAPHSAEEKETEFDSAPFGIIGLETALGLVVTELIDKGLLSWSQAIAKLTVNPAKVMGLETGRIKGGYPADVTVIDPEVAWTVDVKKFRSKCRNSPFGGRKLKGRVLYTIVDGNIVFRAEK